MRKKWTAILTLILATTMILLSLSGCMPSSESEPETPRKNTRESALAPQIPENLEVVDGTPQLLVYNVASDTFQQLDIETYIMGVVAGEMRNDWPMEALKAQAILARTYALKFCQDKTSSYAGADISTDVSEAQAYDESAVNDRVRRAVEDTRGLVMSAGVELPYAWFHAHAGGMTELANAALDYKEEEPTYTQVIESPESDMAPTTVKNWSVTFTTKEIGQAAAKTGVKTGAAETIEVGDTGASGRAITLDINGKHVSAPALRIALGANKLKSTMITDIALDGDRVTFKGRGYGHGVGMSQWGAYGMAQDGKTAEEIVEYYFRNVSVVPMWD